jgi:hypothetical protein
MNVKSEYERPVELYVDPDGPSVKLIAFGCFLAIMSVVLLVGWLLLIH